MKLILIIDLDSRFCCGKAKDGIVQVLKTFTDEISPTYGYREDIRALKFNGCKAGTATLKYDYKIPKEK